MVRTVRPFFICLLCTSVALAAAAYIYSRQHPHSSWIMTAALPAFLCEAFFYLASVFKETREWFRRLRIPRLQSLLLLVSGVLPYLIFSLSAGTFNRNAFYLTSALSGILSFWFTVLPRRPVYDLGFLIIAAAPQITRVFARIYVPPERFSGLDVLGHLAWIHIGIFALLVLREWNPGEFGLWPTRKEWQTGLLVFLIGIAPLAGLAEGLHYAHFVLPHSAWWRVVLTGVGTFLGIFAVVALSEELFFRGFIQRALQNHWRSPLLAIPASSVLFGSAHLWTHQFPNWRYALVAALLGVLCGWAYWWAGSVRASMVTHACVVVCWRLFFA